MSLPRQRYFRSTNVGDVFEGHGTHVSASAAGSAAAQPAAEYSGMAPEAKLAFDDISRDGEMLYVPNDLNTGLFPHSYAAGARYVASGARRGTGSYAVERDRLIRCGYAVDEETILQAHFTRRYITLRRVSVRIVCRLAAPSGGTDC